MQNNFFSAILFFCSFIVSFNSSAQNIEADSLALVALYNNTGGPDWSNQSNWLSTAPVSNWYGVTVTSNRVTALNLSDNNLSGVAPAAFNNLNVLNDLDLSNNALSAVVSLSSMTSLNKLRLQNNQLNALPQTGSSVLFNLSCENNQLDFGDLQPFVGLVVGEFKYSPQAEVGETRFRYFSANDDLTLSVEVGGTENLYQWYKDNELINSNPQTFPELDIFDAGNDDEGDYVVEITNNQLPDLVLTSHPIRLRQFLRDGLGGEYVPNQLIVEFTADATAFERDTMLAYYEAERLEICMCGVLELWLLPDTSITPQGEVIIGVEGVKEDAVSKAKVEDADKNYLMRLLGTEQGTLIADTGTKTQYFRPTGTAAEDDIVPVALIDVGIDTTVSSILPWIWTNEDENNNNTDSDGNCLIDDTRGYNFVDENRAPMDAVNGHGTHLAGIIANGSHLNIQIMNIQTHDESGQGLLFEATCAIYYAFQQGAKVINLSWGYRGEPVAVLENAIARAGEDCGAIVITSAGNEGENNDLFPHYPSSYTLDNIIAVAALNKDENALLPESNYGLTSVDLAAPGDSILSNLPNPQGLGLKSGTSMAAAAVSRGAAFLFLENPEATYLNVIEALMSTTIPLATLDSIASGGKMNLDAAFSFIQTAEPNTSCLLSVATSESFKKLNPLKIYPQPFSERVFIELDIDEPSNAEMIITDVLGRMVYFESLVLQQGPNQIRWNGRSNKGTTLPAGLYFVALRINDQIIGAPLLKQSN